MEENPSHINIVDEKSVMGFPPWPGAPALAFPDRAPRQPGPARQRGGPQPGGAARRRGAAGQGAAGRWGQLKW